MRPAKLVNGMPMCIPHRLKFGRAHARDFFELIRNMRDAAVPHLERNLAQA